MNKNGYGNLYNAQYYQSGCGADYNERATWEKQFQQVAEQLVMLYHPKTFLDVGCAYGYLVAAMRDLGVEAYGIDVSAYAISQVREDIRPYCFVCDASREWPEVLPEKFDCISTIEVAEHLHEEDAQPFLHALCSRTEQIVFSSTPDDFAEKTHYNVQQQEYWAKRFAQEGFFRDQEKDLSVLSPQAISFSKKAETMPSLVESYEHGFRLKDYEIKKGKEQKREKEAELRAASEGWQQESQQLRQKIEQQKLCIAEKEEQLETQKSDFAKEEGKAKEEFRKQIENQKTEFQNEIGQIRADAKAQRARLRKAYEQKIEETEAKGEETRRVLQAELENRERERAQIAAAYNAMVHSSSWFVTKPLRVLVRAIRKIRCSKQQLPQIETTSALSNTTPQQPEHLWPQLDWNGIGQKILEDQQNEMLHSDMLLQIEQFEHKPLISVLVPMYNPMMEWLPRVVECLQEQVYSNWELCICDDGSTKSAGREYMAIAEKHDPRIRLLCNEKNGGISCATNTALQAAKGEYIALLDQDDEITSDALFWMVKRINEQPDVDFLYSDECKLDTKAAVKYFDFYFKPDWSPRLLMNHMYTGHFSLYKTQIVKQVGGFRSEYDFSQDYDLALRVSSATNRIAHVERVLYFWRAIPTSAATGAKDFARVSNVHALKDWYNNHHLDVVMQAMPCGNYGRIIWDTSPLVSVIIPTDNEENLRQSLKGLTENTSYSNLEIVPVTNSALADEIVKEFAYLETKLAVSRYDKPYNFSDKCNQGAKCAKGSILIFYNDDVYPKTCNWIENLLDMIALPDVGSVSPMLMHTDGSIQYAGMITGVPGLVGTAFNNYPADDYVYGVFNHMVLRDVTVLSGACFAIRKEVFEKVGGFDAQNTPNGHSDVDLSFKLLEANYYNVYNPYAQLVHVGNHTWHETEKKDKSDIFCLKRWGKYLERDAFFTDPIKQMYYTDFRYKFKIYMPDVVRNSDSDGQDVLFVTHELSRTGAPIVMKDAVMALREQGHFVVVLSYQDGPLLSEYRQLGVPVIIDEAASGNDWMFERFARNFDIVFANTIATCNVVELLRNSLPRVYWWLHDGSYALEIYKDRLPKDVGNNVRVLFVSDYVRQVFATEGVVYPGTVLHYGVEDGAKQLLEETLIEEEEKLFLFAGSFEERKGVDILQEAIALLPDDILGKCKFELIGKAMYPEVYQEAVQFAKRYSNVKVEQAMPRKKIWEKMRRATAVIIPSRDEPLSAVAVEGMMMSCVPLCSDRTGVIAYLQEGTTGFIFPNGDARALANKIQYVIEHPQQVLDMQRNARKLYEAEFTQEKFQRNFQKIVN